MAEATLENGTCENCGADVRENTAFCFNCGKKFNGAATAVNGTEHAVMSDETRSALDDLAAKFKIDETGSEDKLALAAAERKKARVAPKKSKEVVWEPDETRSGLFVFFVSLFIFLIVVTVVVVTVYWK